jgi:hypothetical protein
MTEVRYVAVSIFAIAAGMTSPPSSAQSLEERLRACALKETQDAKLACYESLTPPAPAAAPAPPPVRAAEQPSATPRAKDIAAPDSEFGLQGELLRRKRGPETASVPVEPEKLIARVTEVTRRAGGTYGFELDNGQVWVETEHRQGPTVARGQTITISSGSLGAYFLSNESGVRSAVKRVR